MDNVTALLAAQKGSSEGGGSNPHAVLYTAQTLSDEQQAQARTNIGIDLSAYELKPTVEGPTGASVTITPLNNTIYKCGTLSSLTITDPPSTGSYTIVFTSGATATSTTIPTTIKGLERFYPEANTIYEIDVFDNRAAVGFWEVGA